MKYIFICDADGLEFPVFCLAPKTHAEMATAWRRNDQSKVVSAGFCEFGPFGQVATFGFSTSLNLGPRPNDSALIEAFYRAGLATAVGRARLNLGQEGRPVPA